MKIICGYCVNGWCCCCGRDGKDDCECAKDKRKTEDKSNDTA